MFAPGAVGGKGGLGPGSDGAGGRGTSLRSVSFCKNGHEKISFKHQRYDSACADKYVSQL